MVSFDNYSAIHINNIDLWAHVGVLDEERLLGQSFLLDITIWFDVENASLQDNLSLTVDYSKVIKSIQQLSFEINCMTIEKFSELIFDEIETLYGPLPMEIDLSKCSPPIAGFNGTVSINRKRNISDIHHK